LKRLLMMLAGRREDEDEDLALPRLDEVTL
jgi:hypothetical protein